MYMMCMVCREDVITDPDLYICKSCQKKHPDLDMSAEWFVEGKAIEAKMRAAARWQMEQDRKGKNPTFDPTPAELGDKSLDDVIESVEGEGAIEPFKEHPQARYYDAPVTKQIDTIADILHAKGIKGYDPKDLANSRKWLVLVAYIQAGIKDELTGSQWSTTDFMVNWVNGFLTAKGQKSMSKHTFKKTLRDAKIEIEHYGLLRLKQD